MRKNERKLRPAIAASLVGLSMLLSSCDVRTVYRVGVDEEHGLRFVQSCESDNCLSVDEYYYDGPARSGRIAMGIVIPESIEGMPVRVMGRDDVSIRRVYDDPEYRHDAAWPGGSCSDFIVATRVPFEEGTSFEFDFDIRADLDYVSLSGTLGLGGGGGGFLMDRYESCPSHTEWVMFDCSFSFAVAEGCRNYYSRDGRLFRRMDDGDKEITMPRQVYVDSDFYHCNCSEPGQAPSSQP
ncbi:MAG: hypothetical protein LKK13_02335 [Bacilli bacterium]|jgi:hypothetical protein|nr:hypothetical protein [Bacilli bacterium]